MRKFHKVYVQSTTRCANWQSKKDGKWKVYATFSLAVPESEVESYTRELQAKNPAWNVKYRTGY